MLDAGEISEMYVGAVTVEAPTPSPPMNLKKEKLYGSIARPEPIAEKKYKTPIPMRVFFLPK